MRLKVYHLFMSCFLFILSAGLSQSIFCDAKVEDVLSKEKRIVLIEGVGGNLSINLLAPEILKLKQRFKDNPNVIFYGSELDIDKITANGREIIKQLNEIGMIIINKAEKNGKKLYDSLQPDYIFLGTPPHTHIKLTRDWLERSPTIKAIMVEKPFSENLSETQQFIQFLNDNPILKAKVFAIDFADDNFNLRDAFLKQVMQYLGTIDNMQFFWIQDHSGSDNSSYLLAGKDSPIARENRISLMPEEKRMVFDTFPHFFNPIEEIISLVNVKITDVKAAQFENAEIPGETFVAARMVFNSKVSSHPSITATLYAGKGIGKVATLDIKRMCHMLILRNKNDKEVRLSIDDGAAYFINKNKLEKKLPLSKLYINILENLFFGKAEFGRTPAYALNTMYIMDQVRQLINEQQKHTKLDQYPLGTSKQLAPSLEEILQNTHNALGEGEDKLLGDELKPLLQHSKLNRVE